jgi:hypothetical protein
MDRPRGQRVVAALIAITAAVAVLGQVGAAHATTAAQKCQAAKLKATGKYAFCLLSVDAKAAKTGGTPAPADYVKCTTTDGTKFSDAETQAAGSCPTQNDLSGVFDQIIAQERALKLLQARFVDNADGTVSDTQTGLMWEQKDNLDGTANPSDPHDADNTYTWCAGTFPNCTNSADPPDGTAYTDFLAKLNNGASTDGGTMTSITGCFAGHCDWRLPTIVELQEIVDMTVLGCGIGGPCVAAPFAPTTQPNYYWSATTYASNPAGAWIVYFYDRSVNADYKTNFDYVRAVRGGL